MIHWTYKIYLFIALPLYTIIAYGSEPPLPKNYKESFIREAESLLDQDVKKKNDANIVTHTNNSNAKPLVQKDLNDKESDERISLTSKHYNTFDDSDVPTLDKPNIEQHTAKSIVIDSKKTIIDAQQSSKSNDKDVKNNRDSINTKSTKSNVPYVNKTTNLNTNTHHTTTVAKEAKKIDKAPSANRQTTQNFNANKPVEDPAQKHQVDKVIVTTSKTKSDLNKSKFIRDETIMLEIPYDDVVEGRITDKAKLKMISSHEYIKEFQQQIKQRSVQKLADAIDDYLLTYNRSFLYPESLANIKSKQDDAIEEAISALVKDNIGNFSAIIDNSPILNTELEYGNNFLHLAVLYNKLDFARYLLSKGINAKKQNNYHLTPYMIADLLRNFDMLRLILNAGINASK